MRSCGKRDQFGAGQACRTRIESARFASIGRLERNGIQLPGACRHSGRPGRSSGSLPPRPRHVLNST
jgi:hypothetical protein